jgi:hypothetical protein
MLIVEECKAPVNSCQDGTLAYGVYVEFRHLRAGSEPSPWVPLGLAKLLIWLGLPGSGYPGAGYVNQTPAP